MSIKLDVKDRGDVANILHKVEKELRGKILRKAMKASQAPVVRLSKSKLSAVQTDEATGQLVRSLKVKTKVTQRSAYAITGPKWPVGAHGHLVELGHEASGWYTGGERVPGKEFLAPAADSTKTVQQQLLINELKNGVEAALASHKNNVHWWNEAGVSRFTPFK